MLVGCPLAKWWVEANCSRKSTCFNAGRGAAAEPFAEAAPTSVVRLTSDCLPDWADTVALGRPIRIDAAAIIFRLTELFAGCMGVTFGRTGGAFEGCISIACFA